MLRMDSPGGSMGSLPSAIASQNESVIRAVFVRSESLGDSRIDLLLIQRRGWRKEASFDDKAPLARPS